MEFEYKNIPADTKIVHAIDYKKIIGESADVNLEEPKLYDSMLELGWKMVKTCLVDGGVGLAAPQLGFPKKIFIMVGFDNPWYWQFNGKFTLCMNPTWTTAPGSETRTEPEGCLSVPGQTLSITRYQEIDVTYWAFNEKKKLEKVVDRVVGYPARIYQHEREHLFGTSIVDVNLRQFGGKKQKKGKR